MNNFNNAMLPGKHKFRYSMPLEYNSNNSKIVRNDINNNNISEIPYAVNFNGDSQITPKIMKNHLAAQPSSPMKTTENNNNSNLPMPNQNIELTASKVPKPPNTANFLQNLLKMLKIIKNSNFIDFFLNFVMFPKINKQSISRSKTFITELPET